MGLTVTSSAVAPILLALMVQIAVNAQTPRAHSVKQILIDGRDVASTTNVSLIIRGEDPRHALHVGEQIDDGTRIDVPQHVEVVIVSTDEKSTATLEPGASVTFVSTGSGELVRSNGGKTIFDVVHGALDFFRVQYGEQITAGVSGTLFSIDASADSVTYACTRGEVDITKLGYLLIGTKPLQTSLIDVISATQTTQATYQPSSTWFLGKFSNITEAESYYEQQLVLAQQSGDANAVNVARMNLGNVQTLLGRYSDALHSYSEALAYYRQVANRSAEAHVLVGIAAVQADQACGSCARVTVVQAPPERYNDALKSYDQALAIFRELGDSDGEASTLVKLGNVQRHAANPSAAVRSWQQALAIYQKLDNPSGEAGMLASIGYVQKDDGKYADALQTEQHALAIYRQLGDRFGEASTLTAIGLCLADQSRYADALETFGQALTIYQQLGYPEGEKDVRAFMRYAHLCRTFSFACRELREQERWAR